MLPGIQLGDHCPASRPGRTRIKQINVCIYGHAGGTCGCRCSHPGKGLSKALWPPRQHACNLLPERSTFHRAQPDACCDQRPTASTSPTWQLDRVISCDRYHALDVQKSRQSELLSAPRCTGASHATQKLIRHLIHPGARLRCLTCLQYAPPAVQAWC